VRLLLVERPMYRVPISISQTNTQPRVRPNLEQCSNLAFSSCELAGLKVPCAPK